MMIRTILGLLIVMIAFSCAQQPSKSELQSENGPTQNLGSSGLRIENNPNRGLNYTDTLETKYSYRYIPITITNDSTIAIHIQIALSNEYPYPAAYGDQKFKVFLLPKELTLDKVTWDSLSYELGNNALRDYFDRGLNPPYILNETLEPGEKCVITMGTIYPRPTNCGVVPNALFLQNNRGLYHECDSLMPARPVSGGQSLWRRHAGGNQDISTIPIASGTPLALGLKLDFCSGSCILIPCGQISFLNISANNKK